MVYPKQVLLASAVMILAQPCLGLSGVPDLFESEAYIAYTGPGVPTLLVVPDGSGPSFAEAHNPAGDLVDATITLILRDGMGDVIVNYPSEDIWLESADGGLAACYYGLIPDSHTDLSGMTTWRNPGSAGGSSQSPVLVLVNATPLASNPGLPLNLNSPDINGDRMVNLTDVSLFSIDYYSGYNFRSDFSGDGVLDLADLPILARHYGSQCP